MRWVVTLSVVVVGCSSECDLAKGLTARSGGGATNCGHAVLGTDPSAVDACVVSAFESGAAFVAQYDRMGSDSRVAFGIAGDVNVRQQQSDSRRTCSHGCNRGSYDGRAELPRWRRGYLIVGEFDRAVVRRSIDRLLAHAARETWD